MEKKLGGKSFKFSSSPLPYHKPPGALPTKKQLKEFLLTMIFAHFHIYNGVEISKIEVNEDDSHGRSDTKIVINGQEKGIQLTKISLNDPLRRINIAEKQTNELLNLFPENINIKYPINIDIYLNASDKNSIPKGNLKQKKKLVELILKGIADNEEKIFGENPEIIFLPIEDTKFPKLANSVAIAPINNDHTSLFPGRNGIQFNSHDWNESDLNNEIERIIEVKKSGEAEILLIWADRFELLYQDKAVAVVLEKKFHNTEFKEVFFLSLFDRVDLFLDSWRLVKIK